MKRGRSFLSVALAVTTFACAAKPANKILPDQLQETITVLDSAVFDAFNRCSDPEQLAKHASYFAEDVEFYHDNGGVTWSRDEMLAKTKKNICGHIRRELVPGTLKVFPIKGFGAIEQGSHRFCQLATDKCEGLAEFTIVWREQAGAWKITRVLSYGHRTAVSEP